MAERRMFSKTIINSARFLKMPISTQALYFHLGLHADDDGVVEAYPIIRSLGMSEDELKVLVAKGFVVVLNEDLVTYLTDWQTNNKIRPDRKIDSVYKPLLLQVLPDVDLLQKRQRADVKKQPMDNQWTTNGQPMDCIGKDSIGEDSIGEVIIYHEESSNTAQQDNTEALHCNTDATPMQRNCNGDIDIEKELDKEKEIEDSLEDKLSPRSSSLAKTHSDVKKRKFTPPSLEELEAYIREEGITNVNPKKFYDHYSDPDRNWKLSNGKRMDNWKLTVRTWGRNAFGTGSPSSDNPLNLSEKEIAYAKWGAERDRILEEQGKKKAQEADYSDCPF